MDLFLLHRENEKEMQVRCEKQNKNADSASK